MERRVGGRDAGGLAGLDGGVQGAVLAAALRVAADADVRLRHLARHRAIERARQLAAVPAQSDGARLAARRADRHRRHRLLATPRGDALRAREEPVARDGERLRARAGTDGRRRPAAQHHAEPHADRHGEPGLRAGRGGSSGREPDRFRDLLSGAPPVLRGGHGTVPLRAELLHRARLRQRGTLLLAPHRPFAAAARRVWRRGIRDGDADRRRRQADRAGPATCRSACSTR